MEFRTINEHPKYEVSACGVVRRKEIPSTIPGNPLCEARVLKRVGARPSFVIVGPNVWLSWRDATEKAWGDGMAAPTEFDAYDPWKGGRPPHYKDVRVITLQEHWAELRSK